MRYSDLHRAATKSSAQIARDSALANLESPFDPSLSLRSIAGEGLRVVGAMSVILATKNAIDKRPELPGNFAALAMAASLATADYILTSGVNHLNRQDTRPFPQPQQG